VRKRTGGRANPRCQPPKPPVPPMQKRPFPQRHPAFTAEAIDEIRNRIKTTVLLTRLQDHAVGEDPTMTTSQIQACSILLKKTLPDLAHVDHTSGGGPLVVEITQFAPQDDDD